MARLRTAHGNPRTSLCKSTGAISCLVNHVARVSILPRALACGPASAGLVCFSTPSGLLNPCLANVRQGPCLRTPCRPKVDQQSELDLLVGHLPYDHRQERPHHVAHPRAHSLEAAQMRLLPEGVQASPGSEEARQDPCRRAKLPALSGAQSIASAPAAGLWTAR